MKVAVTGATGFIGRALCNELAKEHHVMALTRNPEKASAIFDKSVDIIKWDVNALNGWERCLEKTDTIVNLAGTNLASGRWTQNLRAKILNSRINASKTLIGIIKNSRIRPKVVITASAIGFYGSRADEKLDEESKSGIGFLASVDKEIEEYSMEFEGLCIRSVVIRTGLFLIQVTELYQKWHCHLDFTLEVFGVLEPSGYPGLVWPMRLPL